MCGFAPARACLVALALAGCYEEPVPLPEADGGRQDAAVITPIRVHVTPRLPEAISPDVPLRYVAEALDVGQRLTGTVPPAETWPREVTFEPAAQGAWQVVVFVDRDEDGVFDDCPFPPRADDSERAGRLDTLSGRASTRGQAVEVVLDQRICGPGRSATGLAGVVAAVEPVPGPVWALLSPLGDNVLPPLRIVFQDGPLDAALPFSLGEVLPGRWRLTAFVDDDGDGTPSPCNVIPGGGDRYLADPVELEVVEGQRVQLPAPLALRRLACPDALTGLVGEVALPGLVPDPRAGGPLGPLAGTVRLALFPSAGGEPATQLVLMPSIDARPLPHTFTVTNLPVGAWRLVIWIDRDDDGAFTPCGGLEGIDAVWLQQEDVRVVAGELRRLSTLALVQHPCDARAETGLIGTIEVESEEGPVGSGRPLRLELRPRAGGEVLRFPLLANHRTGGRFIVSGLPAGRHDLIFHLDSDRDGVFVDCRQAPYGDRAALAMDDVEIPVGEIVAVEAPVLPLLGCPVPRAELRPRVVFDPRVPAGLAALRLRVAERGGYEETRSLLARHGPGEPEPLLEPIRLAPGEFQLTAWLDTVADGEVGACGSGVDDAAVGQLALRLDAADPVAEPLLVLEPPCP